MPNEEDDMIQFSNEWAQSKFRLALRLKGLRDSNISKNRESAIQLFEEALRVFDKVPLSEERLRCHYELGRLYIDRGLDLPKNNRLRAIGHFEIVLSACTKDEFPELWHATHLQLALIYRRESLEPPNSLARSSEDYHFGLAFAFDKNRHPELLRVLDRIWSLNNRITDCKGLIDKMYEKEKDD